jgi:hypothetical protein
VFYDAESLLCRANKYRHYYGLNATDITGGEPTIYCDPALTKRGLKHRLPDGRNEHLEYLVRHCANIGLAPSIISHGQNYTEAMVGALEDCGVDTFELSIHGMGTLDGQKLGEGNRRLVVLHGGKEKEDGFQHLIDGSKHMSRPIRWNSTVVEQTFRELPDVARFLVDRYPPVVYNMIQFMPYHQHAIQDREFQMTFTDCAPFIAEAVRIVEAAGWECNVRYFPPCVAQSYGFGRNCEMHHRIQYDPFEWAFEATTDCVLKNPWSSVERGWFEEQEFWQNARRERQRLCDAIARERQPRCPPCQSCAARKICEGPDVQYVLRYGPDEMRALEARDLGMEEGSLALDPCQVDRMSPESHKEVASVSSQG